MVRTGHAAVFVVKAKITRSDASNDARVYPIALLERLSLKEYIPSLTNAALLFRDSSILFLEP